MKQRHVQTQVDFSEQLLSCYSDLVYSYSFENQKSGIGNKLSLYGSLNTQKVEYNTTTTTSKQEHCMTKEPFFTTDRWINYEQVNGIQSPDDILMFINNNQNNISKIRGRPVIAYITNIHSDAASEIEINDSDIEEFASLVADIDSKEKEIDIILQSNGGYLKSAHKIIELLRSRFEKVNFLIPLKAYSAASMMCMSADEIVMTPESSLSPFDVQILSLDDNKTYLPAKLMKKYLKNAKRAHNPFYLFVPKSLYLGWDAKKIERTLLFCDISIKESNFYPKYWLMKYMFKQCMSKNMYFSKYFFLPIKLRFTAQGRKANRIVNMFIDIGTKLSHNTPIMYNDLKESGVQVSQANDELLKLLRETYQLSNILFQRSSITKLYIGAKKSYFSYSVQKNSKDYQLSQNLK